MSNLLFYEAVRAVPDNAKKEIKGGRLSGYTDINPMWRIKTLTEQFGPCGVGWKPVIKRSWMEKADNGEIAAFVEIDLFVKVNSEWSDAIPGTGGSMFVAQERNGPYVSDECYKMALTDAISVACKFLGFGADVYWEKDRTKYDTPKQEPQGTPKSQQPPSGSANPQPSETISEAQAKRMFAIAEGATKEDKAETVRLVLKGHGYQNSKDVKKVDYEKICEELQKMPF
jgi:hypothetical protein